MTDTYNPKAFWNDRFRRYGHTGEMNSLLYAYDQPQRLRAIHKALSRAKISIGSGKKILDVGCGTGDLIESFMKRGEPEITGIDISDDTISYTGRRFSTNNRVKFLTIAVEDMNFPSEFFDLVTGINVLQHITNDRLFFKAIENMVRVVKTGGHILVMDFSPHKEQEEKKRGPYVIIRTQKEYRDVFERSGCAWVAEFGLPRLGVRLYAKCVRLVPSRISRLVKGALLKMSRPLDYLLVPFPYKYTDMGILIFQKTSR